MRVHVKGDILSLSKPSSAWLEHFKSIKPFPVCIAARSRHRRLADTWRLCSQANELLPVRRSKDVMGPLGKQPAKKVRRNGLRRCSSSRSC